jgi:hypothetical protein
MRMHIISANIFVGAAIAMVTVVSQLGAATITYNFDDGTTQGWTNVLASPSDPPTQFEATNRSDSGAPAAQSGSYRILPVVTSFGSPFDQDSSHNTLVFRSPVFQLDTSGSISLYLIVGMGTLATPGADFASLPATSASSGFLGVGLRRVSDGAYVLSERRSSNSATTWEQRDFTNTEITTAGLVGVPLTLDFIDYREGSFGWVGLDTVTINGVPEPNAALLLMIGIAGTLRYRRRKLGSL